MKHDIVNESVALTNFILQLKSQSVTIYLVQQGLILSKSHPFLGAPFDFIVTNVDNLETWKKEIKSPSSKLDQNFNDVFKIKNFTQKRGRFS